MDLAQERKRVKIFETSLAVRARRDVSYREHHKTFLQTSSQLLWTKHYTNLTLYSSGWSHISFESSNRREGGCKHCLLSCLSSLRDFAYRPFISSQDHAKPHFRYTSGRGWCQLSSGDDTQRQIQRQIHRQRPILSSSKTHLFLKSRGFKDFKYDMEMNMSDMDGQWTWTWWTQR